MDDSQHVTGGKFQQHARTFSENSCEFGCFVLRRCIAIIIVMIILVILWWSFFFSETTLEGKEISRSGNCGAAPCAAHNSSDCSAGGGCSNCSGCGGCGG